MTSPEANPTPAPPAASRISRAVSAAEFLLAAAIVIAHNVYRVVPNEVPILFILGMLSFRIRDGGWQAMGFRRPESWGRVVAIAVAAAALRLALGSLVVEPLTGLVWPPIHPPAIASGIPGNLRNALLALLIVWTFAAVGEEVSYRGYLTGRAADLGGRTTAAWWAATVVASVLFGYGHFYKGPAGIVDSGVAGLILGTAYLLTGRNLWTCVLAHGLIDTAALVALFFGWAS
ncbi:MAG TPA: CPBP family intramembrane glutamic endopeptidase [Thermoanaerobaculaceae bacterium]|nr:CPBP family intramembrane glutamic endopeptidase [Thermoanaerobaculaceae bacterium]